MYGVPTDLDLSRFMKATLEFLGIGRFQIQFGFHPESCISVMGKWELRDSTGVLVDEALDTHEERDSYRLNVVLGKSVEGYLVSAPDSFSLRFESGHTLTIFDDSKQYESFSIQPGDIFV